MLSFDDPEDLWAVLGLMAVTLWLYWHQVARWWPRR